MIALLIIIGILSAIVTAETIFIVDQRETISVCRSLLRRYEKDEEERHNSKPICACSHSHGDHKDGGQCRGWRTDPSVLGWATGTARCVCTHYTGPEPLPQYYHPLELR